MLTLQRRYMNKIILLYIIFDLPGLACQGYPTECHYLFNNDTLHTVPRGLSDEDTTIKDDRISDVEVCVEIYAI